MNQHDVFFVVQGPFNYGYFKYLLRKNALDL